MTTADERRLWQLQELASAVADMDGYDDFGEPDRCRCCLPREPEAYQQARQRVHEALKALGLKP